MSKHFKGAAVVQPSDYDVLSPIVRAKAVRLLSQRTPDAAGDPNLIGRISKRIERAAINGDLEELSPGVFKFGDLIRWARVVYPGIVDDLPTSPSFMTSKVSIRFGGRGELRGQVRPDTLAGCHAEIERLEGALVTLERKLTELQRENAILRVDSEKWQKNVVEKNRKNAKAKRTSR